MNFAKHEELFSKSRLDKYLKARNGNHSEAIRLYEFNILVSQALYPLISILEVALRNGIDKVLIGHFQDYNWLISKRSHFATHHLMLYTDSFGNIRHDNYFKEKLDRATVILTNKRRDITHENLLAELTFGFWVKFYESSSIKILHGSPLKAFKNRPSKKLSLIHSHLNSIVKLRNRISHNEPICFDKGGKLCLKTIEKYEINVCDSLYWIDTDLASWMENINPFKHIYNKFLSLQAN